MSVRSKEKKEKRGSESWGLTCCGSVCKTGRHSDGTGGGVSSIFSACPEEIAPNHWRRVHLQPGRAPVARLSLGLTGRSECVSRRLLLSRHGPHCLHVSTRIDTSGQSTTMKRRTLHFLGRKSQSLFDTNIQIKDMGEFLAVGSNGEGVGEDYSHSRPAEVEHNLCTWCWHWTQVFKLFFRDQVDKSYDV